MRKKKSIFDAGIKISGFCSSLMFLIVLVLVFFFFLLLHIRYSFILLFNLKVSIHGDVLLFIFFQISDIFIFSSIVVVVVVVQLDVSILGVI